MTIQAITFDLDDTLWPIAPVIDKANQMVVQWLLENAPRFIETYGEQPFKTLQQQVLAESPTLINSMTQLRMAMLERGFATTHYANPKALAKAAFAVYYQWRHCVVFYPGAIEQLQQLHSRYRMGSISNGNADIHKTGLGQWFEFGLSADTIGSPKPEPALFQCAMEYFNLQSKHIIHVGDNPIADIYGAQRMGMATIWVNLDNQSWPPELNPAAAEINHLSELSEAVEKIQREGNRGAS